MLERVEISVSFEEMDPSDVNGRTTPFVDGFNAVLFTVLVTDPRGYMAQVGGHGWYGAETSFFMKEWPAMWYAPYPASHVFEAGRDVRAAGLRGDGRWVVEITSGYSSPVTPRKFRGNITFFTTRHELDSQTLELRSGSGLGSGLGHESTGTAPLRREGSTATVNQMEETSLLVIVGSMSVLGLVALIIAVKIKRHWNGVKL
eukprot:gene8187-16834_t